jgi:hypothetical protein
MSKAGVQAVVNKAMSDETFRKKLKENPSAALSGFDLTPEEINALKSGDKTKLQQLGVDERISKTITDSFIPNIPTAEGWRPITKK